MESCSPEHEPKTTSSSDRDRDRDRDRGRDEDRPDLNHSRVSNRPLQGQAADDDGDGSPTTATKRKKPIGFHLSFVGLLISVFVYSLDATTLAVAIPVRDGILPCSLDPLDSFITPRGGGVYLYHLGNSE